MLIGFIRKQVINHLNAFVYLQSPLLSAGDWLQQVNCVPSRIICSHINYNVLLLLLLSQSGTFALHKKKKKGLICALGVSVYELDVTFFWKNSCLRKSMSN